MLPWAPHSKTRMRAQTCLARWALHFESKLVQSPVGVQKHVLTSKPTRWQPRWWPVRRSNVAERSTGVRRTWPLWACRETWQLAHRPHMQNAQHVLSRGEFLEHELPRQPKASRCYPGQPELSADCTCACHPPHPTQTSSNQIRSRSIRGDLRTKRTHHFLLRQGAPGAQLRAVLETC